MPTRPPSGPVRALTMHADYACRHTGRCCTSGWAIPVEAPLHRALSAALAAGRLQVPAGSGADTPAPFQDREPRPADAAAILATHASGACVFFDGPPANLCALQRQGGVAWLPASCRHFPRVALLDGRGTSITLSHYCPTAARQLFRTDVPLAITTAPAAFPSDVDYEGFDARDTWPPLLRPGVLADLETYDIWETRLVNTFADETLSPEEALRRILDVTETLRAWTPPDGPLVPRARAVCAMPAAGDAPADAAAFLRRHVAASWALHGLAAASVPEELAPPAATIASPAVWREHVEPAWRTFSGPVRRYLAARAFGSWLAYQGQGLRTVAAGVTTALGVLRVEATRLAARHARVLDEPLLVEAFGEADRLLVHLASPDAFAHHLAGAEASAPGDWLQALADGAPD